MAKLLQNPNRFTMPEWNISNKTLQKHCEVERQTAERLVAESNRLADETEERKDKTQVDVDKRYDQRLDDIRFWRDELQRKLDEVKAENTDWDAYRNRVEMAIQACAEPLHVAQQNLANREKRQNIELTHDDVQKELIKEVEVLQGIMELLHKTLDQLKEQSRLNRKAIFYLEKDIQDKNTALSIDEHGRSLTDTTPGNDFCEKVTWIDSNSLSVAEWERATEDNIKSSDKNIKQSKDLRSLVDGLFLQTWNDATKQRSETDNAMRKRIAELCNEKEKMEDHLNKVLEQIRQMDENADSLRKAIAEKEAPLKLAHTRLCVRQERQDVELTRDMVHYRMVSEIGELEQGLADLNNALNATQDTIKTLRRKQLELETDIERKAAALFIDEVENLGMRQSIKIEPW